MCFNVFRSLVGCWLLVYIYVVFFSFFKLKSYDARAQICLSTILTLPLYYQQTMISFRAASFSVSCFGFDCNNYLHTKEKKKKKRVS